MKSSSGWSIFAHKMNQDLKGRRPFFLMAWRMISMPRESANFDLATLTSLKWFFFSNCYIMFAGGSLAIQMSQLESSQICLSAGIYDE